MEANRRGTRSVGNILIVGFRSIVRKVFNIQPREESYPMGESQRRAIEKSERRLARLRSRLGYPGDEEPPFVNINKKKELHYWAVKFGHGKDAVKYAVEHVGTDPEKVKTFVYGLR